MEEEETNNTVVEDVRQALTITQNLLATLGYVLTYNIAPIQQ